jgi:hypothetical protein
LNSGRYVLNLRVSLHGVRWIVHSDAVLYFDIVSDHGESLFLNHPDGRPGVVAPVLDWASVEPASDDAVETPYAAFVS